MKRLKIIAACAAGSGAFVGLALAYVGAAWKDGQAGLGLMVAGALMFGAGAALLRAVLHG